MKRIMKWFSNRVIGEPSKGCQLCSLGSKLVLFITGECDSNCFYCPLSKEKRKDLIYANEQLITSVQEAIHEAKMISALGVGITGGEPTHSISRVLSYISELKKEFGNSFHCHLYTSHAIPVNQLNQLHKAGLDEIRFHPPRLNLSKGIKSSITQARKLNWEVGIEIPVIPDEKQKIIDIIDYSIENNLDFLNLNELEITEANFNILEKRGYKTKNTVSAAVLGSESLAHNLLKKYKKSKITIHYCSSSFKDSIQLRNRYIRRAKNYAKPYDEITDEGLIVRARIIVNESEQLDKIQSVLINKYKVNEEYLEIREECNTIYLNWYDAQKYGQDLNKQFQNKIKSIHIIQQYPYPDGIITYLEPIIEDYNS
ncbi:MAG: radical SAM protein [Candidatus Thorarchaeota archaeon]